MIIDFENISETVEKNFKGGEKDTVLRMFVDKSNKIMYIKLQAGASIGVHTHETNSEIIYVLSGKGTVLFDNKCEEISQGLCHYCPKGHSHSLINNSNDDLTFFAVVPEQ